MWKRPYGIEWISYNADVTKQQLKLNERRHDAHRQNLKFADDRLKLTANPQALNHGTIIGKTMKNISLMLSRSYTGSRIL